MEIVEIGIVHTSYEDADQIPRSREERMEEEAVVEVFPEYAEGLKDLEGFSHIMLIAHLHRAEQVKLLVTPPFDGGVRGVFATRSPLRPNHLGVTVVELVKVEGRNLHVKGIDLLDGTPLMDIKPYIPYDAKTPVGIGWLEGKLRARNDGP